MTEAKPLKIVFLGVDAVEKKRFSWLTSNGKPFERMEALDFKDDFLEKIFKIYKDAYSAIDNRLFLSDKYQLLNYTTWVVLTDSSQNPVGFFLCKEHKNGLKLGITAAVDRKNAKSALVNLCRKAMNVKGVFGEVSPPLEKVLIGHVPEVEAHMVKNVLAPGKSVEEVAGDGKHYSRTIRNIGKKRKLMVGRPIL